MDAVASNDFLYDVIVASPNSALDSYYILSQLNLGSVNRAKTVLHTAGGKGINLARAVNALEGRAMSLGILGGYTGKFIAQELEREKISSDIIWTDSETRRTSTLIVEDKMQTTVILETGNGGDPQVGDQFIEKISSYARLAPFLVLTGSLPSALAPDYYARIIMKVREVTELQIFLDCSGEVLRLAVAHGAHGIKVNSKEFQESFTDDRAWNVRDTIRIFEELSRKGLELLIITDGPQGAYLFTRQHPPFRVVTTIDKWVNTAGAGDTFMAGLLVGLRRGMQLREAAQLASAAAAAKLQQVICGSLCMEDLERFLPLTRIELLSTRDS